MTNYEFYIEMSKTIKALATERNISENELENYFVKPKVKYAFSEWFEGNVLYTDSKGIPLTFAKMLFHLQDTPLLSKIMEFNDKFNYFLKFTEFFILQRFLDKFTTPRDACAAMNSSHISKNLNYHEEWCKHWRKFVDEMFACANYLKDFSSESDVMADIEFHNTSRAELIKYFVEKGIGVDSSSRFLNSFIDTMDLPQINSQLKDVISARCGKKKRFYNSKEGEIELIKDVTNVVEDINKTLKQNNEKTITAIQLERMIYLASTGRFYLHKNSGHKESFLNRIKG